MSTKAQYVGAIFAIIAIATGYGAYAGLAFYAGTMIGTLIFPEDPIRSRGPRLEDAQVQASRYGVPIPVIYGTDRWAGTVIWASEIRELEETRETGGKGDSGGQVVTTFTYEADFDILYSEGPVVGAQKIWADKKLLRDYSDTSFHFDGDIGTLIIYKGDGSETPNPTIQAAEGDLTPWHKYYYRHVWINMPLGDYGNRIPIMSQVGVGAGTNALLSTDISTSALTGRNVTDAFYLAERDEFLVTYSDAFLNNAFVLRIDPYTGSIIMASNGNAWSELDNSGVTFNRDQTRVYFGLGAGNETSYRWMNVDTLTYGEFEYDISKDCQVSLIETVEETLMPTSKTLQGPAYEEFAKGIIAIHPSKFWDTLEFVRHSDKNVLVKYGASDSSNWVPFATGKFTGSACSYPFSYLQGTYDAWIGIAGKLSGSLGSVAVRQINFDGGFINRHEIDGGPTWTLGTVYDLSSTFNNPASYSDVDVAWFGFTDESLVIHEYVLVRTHNKLCRINVTLGQVDGDVLTNINIPDWMEFRIGLQSNFEITWLYSGNQTRRLDLINWVLYDDEVDIDDYTGTSRTDGFTYLPQIGAFIGAGGQEARIYWENKLTPQAISLETVVESIIDRTGLPVANRECAALASIGIDGYLLARTMSARSALQPLIDVFFFDLIRSGTQIVAKVQGGASLRTIPTTQLGVSSGGGDNTPLITRTIASPAEIATQVQVTHKRALSDYQESSQTFKRHDALVTGFNPKEVTTPVVMTDQTAHSLAQKLLQILYTSDVAAKTSTNLTNLDLEPADVVTIDGQDWAIGRVSIGVNNVIEWDLVAIDQDAFTAITGLFGSPQGHILSRLGHLTPSRSFVFDFAPYRPEQDKLGVYYFAAPDRELITGAVWDGANIWTGTEQFVQTDLLDSVLNDVSYGQVIGTLPDQPSEKWDRTSSIRVRWISGEDRLASSTEVDVAKQDNWFIIGNEIVGIVNVTDNGDGTFQFDTMMRGRLHTEDATSTHTTDEYMLFIELETTYFTDMPAAWLSTTRYHRADTLTRNLPSSTSGSTSFVGNSLKPPSVVVTTVSRDVPSAGEIRIEWLPRARYHQGNTHNPVLLDTEAYEVDLYDPTGTTVQETVTGITSLKRVDFDNTQLTNAGYTDNNDPIYLSIYRISSNTNIGRGYTKLELV